MRRVGRYSRMVGKLLILVTIGILFMLGRYVVRRLSGHFQAAGFDAIDLPPVEKSPIAIEEDDATRSGIADDSSSSPEAIAPGVEESAVAKLIPASEEPINETVSPIVADSFVLEKVEVPEEKSRSQPEAYCVKCRTRRGMKDARRIVTKNKRNAMEGICPVCGTRLFRFIATSS